VSYETRYVIVAGIAWIRWTRVGTDEHVWLIVFGDGEPRARKGPAGENSTHRGELEGVSWRLDAETLAPPFRSPHALLRRFASTQMVVQPCELYTGRVGDREFRRAPGHSARLWGTRHAQSWGWAHASDADGRWAHLLTATLPGLPRLSQYATHERAPGLPLARGRVEAPRVRVGPLTVEADPASFLGLRYTDTDGSTIWCYHSERARGLLDVAGAMEIASRAPIPGWTVAL
jgi:hypothetical protein